MIARIDLSGLRFGKLTAVRAVSWSPTKWIAKCDCGQEVVVMQGNICNGHTTSCGCNRISLHSVTHGHNRGRKPSRTLQSYRHAKSRCVNTDDPKYPDYGGRGIKMCNEWVADFSVFLRDMGECPHGTTIDRIDNDGDYEPSNCRWATKSQQSRNKRNNVLIVHNGQRMIAKDYAKEVGKDYSSLLSRLKRTDTIEKVATILKRK